MSKWRSEFPGVFSGLTVFLAKLAKSVRVLRMAGDAGNQHETSTSDSVKRDRVQQLFGLSEAWLAGGVRDEAFLRESLKLRRTLINEDWGEDLEARENLLLNQFNMAVQCAIAVEQTMRDLKMLAQTSNPPLAMRAFYFGKRVSDEAVLELETVLRFEAPTPSNPDGSLKSGFEPGM